MKATIYSTTRKQTYTVTTDHSASSYGIPVLLDGTGNLVDFSFATFEDYDDARDLYFALCGASHGDDVANEMVMAAYHHRTPVIA